MKNGYIYIGENIFETLFAISEDEQKKGLMFEPWPPPNMTFLYSEPQYLNFWMKSTPSPLDIIFCKNGKIIKICKGEPNSTKLIGNNCFSDMVIELPYGTVKNCNIDIGDHIDFVIKKK